MRAPISRFGLLLLAALTLGLTASAGGGNIPGDWEEVDHMDGITVFRKEIPGSDILAYKGNGPINAPIGKLTTVLTDTLRKPEWMSRIKKTEILRQISPTERLEYTLVSVPWPLADRDFVFLSTLEVDPINHHVTIRYKSVEDPLRPPVPGVVRAWVTYSAFVLTPIEGGTKTQIEAEALADPRGGIPKWMVNIYQRRLPRQSLAGLRGYLAANSIAPHPLLNGFPIK